MKFLIIFLFFYQYPLYSLESIKQTCLGCHEENSQIAPTFEEIYKFYKSKSKDERDLINRYLVFIKDPSESNVILKSAYKKYGAMPKTNLSEIELKEISRYLATGNYADLYKKFELKIPKDPFKKGKAILKATKSELGKNLLGAIKKKKTIGAVTFCQTKALPITQRKMKELNASIKRATDKPRNPNNLANTNELKYIKLFKQELAKGNMTKPILVKTETGFHFYSPIITNQMCLQCHGQEKEDLEEGVLNKIKSLYPNDMALGYTPNQVRGIFSISWDEVTN